MINWKNERVLITGQTGTFGTAMTKKLLELNVKNIIGINSSETNRHNNEMEIKDKRVIRYTCDIAEKEQMEKIIRSEKPTVIMLSAAKKHIEYCEQNPKECYRVNIWANEMIIDLAIKYKVPKVIFLSTDKATSPTTIYGLSKLAIEMYIQDINSEDTTILTTRYGNVLGSNGSVLDIWKRQRDNGEPLTVTNPDMTRFFMSIEQAVDLVLYALENGFNKDLWVYNNKACTIGDLADCISNNQIEVGLRCVEKNDEALLTVNELNHSQTYNNLYFRVNKDIKSPYITDQPFRSDNTTRLTREELMELINEL